MSDRAGRHQHLLVVFGSILAAWGFFLFFQSAYFGALFYNYPIPSWALWVGQLPIWFFNAVDTVMVAILLLALWLEHRAAKRRWGSGRGSATTTALLAVVVLAILIFLGYTFQSFLAGVAHFFGL